MGLAVVRSIGSSRRLESETDFKAFEQELVDQYALAQAGAGLTDRHISADRGTIFEFLRYISAPVWTAGPEDADRYLAYLRKDRRQAATTVHGKALTIAQFFDFLMTRYQGDVHTLAGHVLVQPIDDFNRPARSKYASPRVPPSEQDVETLFSRWRDWLPEARKYLPAARDYLAASLWRRAGLRINETAMLDIRDWRPDYGELGKLHVRHGKGARGRGPKTRLVPAIDSVGPLLTWWLADVRHQFGDDYLDPDAPLLPSERRDPGTGRCRRVQPNALRTGLADAVRRWLPDWQGRLTPHGLRHFCASSLYGRGVDLKAIQDLLGHEWLSTTTGYIHVHDDHIERAWKSANQRVAARLNRQGR
ncbi:tyrosine-type recombinase/integrase [Microbispora hainanensis]|uniref:Tyrosine-type recombinase/integrase n=1 Tax=Microbispora hainanensis TaxID=568844 RepID=A0A544XVH8_9ACTN|nr:tyrosine-type recombinase/integrase [Microbispora hainanensis]TQS08485.1 tyrosine-type recombinase/integrase [Microbispora hainanensis]